MLATEVVFLRRTASRLLALVLRKSTSCYRRRMPLLPHCRRHGAVDAIAALAFVEADVAGLVALDGDVFKIPAQNGMATVLDFAADDGALQFLDRRRHGDPTLTHLDARQAVIGEVADGLLRQVTIESDLLDVETSTEFANSILHESVIDHAARCRCDEFLLFPGRISAHPFFDRLLAAGMTMCGERLPVRSIPEQSAVTTVRDAVVDRVGIAAAAAGTELVLRLVEEQPAFTLPFGGVAALARRQPPAVMPQHPVPGTRVSDCDRRRSELKRRDNLERYPQPSPCSATVTPRR
jgi:hypothetical protein